MKGHFLFSAELLSRCAIPRRDRTGVAAKKPPGRPGGSYAKEDDLFYFAFAAGLVLTVTFFLWI
jgi:hypothetical protein